MGKPPKIPDMPPLTLEMHSELRVLEGELMRALSSCCNSHELTDPDAAVEYVRTYIPKFYDCFYGFYSQIPDRQYQRHWKPASERSTFERVVKCISNGYLIRSFFASNEERIDIIRRTIESHARKSDYPGKPSSFGDRLRALIDEARVTPEGIAEAIDINHRTAYRHLSGQSRPRTKQIGAYEEYLSKRLKRIVKLDSPE